MKQLFATVGILLTLVSLPAVAASPWFWQGTTAKTHSPVSAVGGPSGTAAAPAYTFNSDTDTGLFSSAADTLGVSAAGGKAAEFTTGTTTLYGASGAAGVVFKTPEGTAASPTVVLDGDLPGYNLFQGYSGAAATYRSAASIEARIDGEPDTAGDTTDMPGRLQFYTSADGSSTLTERLRIDSTGAVQVGQTTGFAKIRPIAGTVGTPTYTFTGDEDTGVYRSAANTLGVSTGGTNVASFASTGVTLGPSTGIGTVPHISNGMIQENTARSAAENVGKATFYFAGAMANGATIATHNIGGTSSAAVLTCIVTVTRAVGTGSASAATWMVVWAAANASGSSVVCNSGTVTSLVGNFGTDSMTAPTTTDTACTGTTTGTATFKLKSTTASSVTVADCTTANRNLTFTWAANAIN